MKPRSTDFGFAWAHHGHRELRDLLRALPERSPAFIELDAANLFACAELHGVSGLVFDAWRQSGTPLDAGMASGLEARELARELDHAAHLALLARVDRAFGDSGLRGVLLKGPLLAERLYPRPASRATSDVDLLVAEADLERASSSLTSLGYVGEDSPGEDRFRREHHHLHFSHPHALPLELHFHAYRGFGRRLRSESLISRSRPIGQLRQSSLRSRDQRWTSLRVLEPADELVYLAVHAAAHRFVRLGWLFDMKLLVATMSNDDVARAAERAREWGFMRPLALAATLLERVLHVSREKLSSLGNLGAVRRRLALGVLHEPENGLLRSATRFIYTASLCDSFPAAVLYATTASTNYAKRQLGFQE